MNAAMEMPRYRSHKEVWALKIAAIEFAEDGSAKIAPDDSRYDTIKTGDGFRAKFNGCANDLGYYVVHVDLYEHSALIDSWVPIQAFEKDYTLVSK